MIKSFLASNSKGANGEPGSSNESPRAARKTASPASSGIPMPGATRISPPGAHVAGPPDTTYHHPGEEQRPRSQSLGNHHKHVGPEGPHQRPYPGSEPSSAEVMQPGSEMRPRLSTLPLGREGAGYPPGYHPHHPKTG